MPPPSFAVVTRLAELAIHLGGLVTAIGAARGIQSSGESMRRWQETDVAYKRLMVRAELDTPEGQKFVQAADEFEALGVGSSLSETLDTAGEEGIAVDEIDPFGPDGLFGPDAGLFG